MLPRLPILALTLAFFIGQDATAQSSRKARKPTSPPATTEPASSPAADSTTEPPPDRDAPAASKDQEKPARKRPRPLERATFGGGCFWCTEAYFERLPGVKDVVSGYSGGHVANPSYEMVCTGLTGHAEVIQIVFDPNVLSFEKLLRHFWTAHDPTTLNSQGPDFGTQYRSIILYHNEDQKAEAEKQYKELMARRKGKSPIVTELVPFQAFYPADDYHQDYYRNHPDAGYSQTYIEPKVRKLQQKLRAEQKPK
jgi:peptide-methionine (S)-S-oxide reductase